jgi:hypothetical protein
MNTYLNCQTEKTFPATCFGESVNRAINRRGHNEQRDALLSAPEWGFAKRLSRQTRNVDNVVVTRYCPASVHTIAFWTNSKKTTSASKKG